jgi:ubiquinone/menaquinone biosynthesis C-methylase UbiE
VSRLTWEEAVAHLRTQPSYAALIEQAYLSGDLATNIERFRDSVEWEATLQIIKTHTQSSSLRILDIGAGNGIASIAFALEGYTVSSLEPDPGHSVGAGAIRSLAKHFNLQNITVIEGFGEQLPFEDESFDVVYCRQVLHHAADLNHFLKECYRVCSKNGLLLTVRDHVIKNDSDKQVFLKKHPLHKLYGGENAFTLSEYRSAITGGGFKIKQTLNAAESALNYSPWTEQSFYKAIRRKLPLPNSAVLEKAAWRLNLWRLKQIPGTVYSFIATKEN